MLPFTFLFLKKSEIPLRTLVFWNLLKQRLTFHHTFIPLGLEVREVFYLLLITTPISFFLPSVQYLSALNFVSPAYTTNYPLLAGSSADPGSIFIRLLASGPLSLFLINQNFAPPTNSPSHTHFLKLFFTVINDFHKGKLNSQFLVLPYFSQQLQLTR